MSGKQALAALRHRPYRREEAPRWFREHVDFENDLLMAARFLLWHRRATLKERLHFAITGNLELFDCDPDTCFRQNPYR